MMIYESGENYLETILQLRRKNSVVRSVDVAAHLGVSKASVSFAMKALQEAGYIEMLGAKELHLTQSGEILARSVYERHRFFTDWLISLGVDPVSAERDACRMEHSVSAESFAAIKRNQQAKKQSASNQSTEQEHDKT